MAADYNAMKVSSGMKPAALIKKRKAEVIFERETTVVFTGRYPRLKVWCAECATEAEMVTVFEAAKLARVSIFTIHGRADGGELHHQTTSSGVRMVCVNSL